MLLHQNPTNKWLDWFAWYPVRTEEGELLWLEKVQKKWFHCPVDNVSPSSWIIYKRK